MIDVKSLRIGSHVSIDGKRERVRGLDEDNGLIVRFPAEYVMASDVEPILITPALLEELGFKYKRPVCLWIKASENEYLSFDRICGTKHYRVHLYSGGIDRGKCACLYLHEAEAFLALHGVELIKD